MNVVIHEFAHKLDLYAGAADGMPALSAHPDLRPAYWQQVLDESFDLFHQALDAVEAAIPSHVDPASDADRKSVGSGKSVSVSEEIGGCRMIKKKTKEIR